MTVTINQIEDVDIITFAERHGLAIEVVERRRSAGDPMRFYAVLTTGKPGCHDVDVMKGIFLCGVHGNGSTPNLAIYDAAREYSFTRLAIRAGHPDRSEVEVPRLHYTPSSPKETES